MDLHGRARVTRVEPDTDGASPCRDPDGPLGLFRGKMSVDDTFGRDNWLTPTRIGSDVDDACDRFEAAWRAGGRPLIEGFLGDATSSRRSAFLRYLLAVELDYRGGLGEAPKLSEYQVRFAGHERLIDSAFAEFTRRFELARAADLETIELGTGLVGTGSRPATKPPPDPFPNIPGFEILSELGRGGMGIVYKARNLRLNRLCALKMVLPGRHAGAEARARFFAEAETIARLRHPNLVQIHSLGDVDGRPYFEMEYFEGGSLSRRLDGTPWAPGPAARMVAMLARAIGDAHRLGIVHRDLKPANVLLTDDQTPKVVDFGLAKSLEADAGLTQSGVFVGTPSYAAPEQVAGSTQAFGPAADIYALGAIFYHMLTGRPPFQAATALRTLEQVRTADPVPPSRLQPGLPRDAETIALKCLEKDPHRRYADAAAFAEDLDRFLDGRPILARSTGAVELLRKSIRRRPAVALLSVVMLAGTFLSFILVVGNGDARKPRPPRRPSPTGGRNRPASSRSGNRPSSRSTRRWPCATRARWRAASRGWSAAWSWPRQPSPTASPAPSASTSRIGRPN